MSEYKCVCGGTVKFEAWYGAPGTGQSWKCESCNHPYQKIGTSMIDLRPPQPTEEEGYCEFCGATGPCAVCGRGMPNEEPTLCYECGKNPPKYAGYCKECMDEANSVETTPMKDQPYPA